MKTAGEAEGRRSEEARGGRGAATMGRAAHTPPHAGEVKGRRAELRDDGAPGKGL